MRLKSREKFIPNGFVYYVPQIPLWRPQPNSSLDSLSQQVLTLRQANPFLTQKHGWSLDLNAILNELDEYNATWCAQNGWDAYISGAGGSAPPIPKTSPPSQEAIKNLVAAGAKIKNLWTGLRTASDWIESGEPAVSADQSESRAQVCAVCPKNIKADWSSWFTKPAAMLVQKQVEKLSERKLTTSKDDVLGICECCDCVNRVKVHTPLELIKAHLKDDVLDKLRTAPACWIVKELAA